MKISVFGLGYVGLANALFLSQNNDVLGYDIDQNKIEDLKHGKSPICDLAIDEFLKDATLTIDYTTDLKKVVQSDVDYYLIATPTNYDENNHKFDTSSIENVISKVLEIDSHATFIIKSTVPVGYTKQIKQKFNTENIIFSPEFLREGCALMDNLYPSRIIVGEQSTRGEEICKMFEECTLKEEISTLLTDSTEAEAIKLFSNTYLAMRVAYFNELDTYAQVKGLDAKQIILGVSLDPRIGNHYNNPSFGYGGYCLPKDTKQLKANFKGIPENMISAIVDSNKTRKKFIADEIIKLNPKKVGIFRLIMKANSDNFRSSSVFDIMEYLSNAGIELSIYEPTLIKNSFNGYRVEHNLKKFKDNNDIIVANRAYLREFKGYEDRLFTRDIFSTN